MECLLLHCGNMPKTMLKLSRMYYQEIIAGTEGRKIAFGIITGRIKASPITFAELQLMSLRAL
jgi:L-fucose isomerase-like protein